MSASGPCWKRRVLDSSPRGSALDVRYDSGICILFSFSENLRPVIHNHEKQSWNVLWLYIMMDGDSPQYFGIGSNYILKSLPSGRGTSPPLWSLTRPFLHRIYHVLRLYNPFTISPSLDYKVHKGCSFACSLVYHVHKTMPLHNDATRKYFWRSKLPKLRITTELRRTQHTKFPFTFLSTWFIVCNQDITASWDQRKELWVKKSKNLLPGQWEGMREDRTHTSQFSRSQRSQIVSTGNRPVDKFEGLITKTFQKDVTFYFLHTPPFLETKVLFFLFILGIIFLFCSPYNQLISLSDPTWKVWDNSSVL